MCLLANANDSISLGSPTPCLWHMAAQHSTVICSSPLGHMVSTQRGGPGCRALAIMVSTQCGGPGCRALAIMVSTQHGGPGCRALAITGTQAAIPPACAQTWHKAPPVSHVQAEHSPCTQQRVLDRRQAGNTLPLQVQHSPALTVHPTTCV